MPEPENTSHASLSVSIVCYIQPAELLEQTLEHLYRALKQLEAMAVSVDLVDNTNDGRWKLLFEKSREGSDFVFQYHHLPDNPGFAAGHNKVLLNSHSAYHLILNPDLYLGEDALSEALQFLAEHPKTVLVSPRVFNDSGEEEYLLKRYPDVLSLALRGFAPAFIRRLFEQRLAHYEMRDINREQLQQESIEICSGCCLLLRTDAARAIGGFDEDFFLYFEDFDFCLRLAGQGQLAYLPTMKATHLGGYASQKGFRHIGLFVSSARRFFQKHGWKWL